MKILVIDDDPTVQAVLEGLLSTIGTVTVVGDAFTAIETVEMAIATGEPFKLICLDIGLPSEDGLTTLEAIHQIEEQHGMTLGNGAKILMVTGSVHTEDVLGAFKLNCDGYLVKPISKDLLYDRLRRLGFAVPDFSSIAL